MALINVVLVLIVVGLLLWAANTIIPMEARIKNVLNVIVFSDKYA